MAPSVLLQQDAPYPARSELQKASPGPAELNGGMVLESNAPTNGAHFFPSSGDATNHSSLGNGPPRNTGISGGRQVDGNDFISSATLLEQSRNFATSGTTCTDSAPKKLNVLYIMADQMAAPLLKMNNPDSVIQTPNLDELAKAGVVFSNAYCNSPLCAPSRFTMCTGQLPSKIAGYDNASEFSSEIPTYAHYLRNEGYETVLAGKMHFIGADQLHGFERR